MLLIAAFVIACASSVLAAPGERDSVDLTTQQTTPPHPSVLGACLLRVRRHYQLLVYRADDSGLHGDPDNSD